MMDELLVLGCLKIENAYGRNHTYSKYGDDCLEHAYGCDDNIITVSVVLCEDVDRESKRSKNTYT